MKRLLFSAAATLAVLLPAASAHAYINAYLKIQGSKTLNFCPINPSGFAKGEILNLNIQEIVSPRDPASGQATGKRTHKPLRMRMYYDQASANLLKTAFASKEPLKSIVLQVFELVPNGKVRITREIVLADGYINAYNAPQAAGGPHVFEIDFGKVLKSTPMQKVQGLNDFKR